MQILTSSTIWCTEGDRPRLAPLVLVGELLELLLESGALEARQLAPGPLLCLLRCVLRALPPAAALIMASGALWATVEVRRPSFKSSSWCCTLSLQASCFCYLLAET